MEEKKPKVKPTVLGRLQVIQAQVELLIAEELRKYTREREYVVSRRSKNPFDADRSSKGLEDFLSVHAEGDLIEPGVLMSFFFGVDHIVEESVFPGIPEMSYSSYGLEHPFALQHVVIHDDDASYFEVEGIYVAGCSAVHGRVFGSRIPATRFAESTVPRPLFKNMATINCDPVCVLVKNISTEPRTFRARVIGREVFMPVAPNVEFVFPELDEAGNSVKP